jgi:hypothetical protein
LYLNDHLEGMDDYFDFEAFKTTYGLAYSQRRIEKTVYDDLVTWAGPAAVCSSFIGISLTTNEW